MKRLAIAILMSFCILGSSGCALLLVGGAAGAGTAYIKGELKDKVYASPAQTRNAIARAIKNLELKPIQVDTDKLSGTVILETGAQQKITVRYKKLNDTSTQISIRVGVFGDENLSRALLEQIKDEM